MKRERRPSPQTTAVVTALADSAGEWSHGYDLCAALGLKAGTMYPILMRLADRGHVETMWETEPPRGRPARHLYRLSPQGAAWATQLRARPEHAVAATSRPALDRGAPAPVRPRAVTP